MYKGVKKYNLNTSDKAHGRLMLKSLFTSLILNGVVRTTEKKAKTLKQYALKQVSYYKKDLPPIVKKTWLLNNISTRKFYKKALENLNRVKDGFKIGIYRMGFRPGDGAIKYEVRILNFEDKKNDEQN